MGLFDFLKKGEEKPAQPAGKPSGLGGLGQPAADDKEYYTVKSGDSLSKIAKEKYGDAQQWPKIHKANMDQISDPNLIHPGQKIVIPRD